MERVSHFVAGTPEITLINIAWLCAAPFGLLLLATPVSAQVVSTTTSTATAVLTLPTTQETSTHLVEWDIPIVLGPGEFPDVIGDSEPAAITVDTRGKDANRVWFLTRRTGLASPQKVYRFDAAKSLMKGSARWTSWALSSAIPAADTGGLKRLRPSDDRRYVFVRTSIDIQRIDTQNCKPATAQTLFTPAKPSTCELTIWSNTPGSDGTVTDPLNVSDLAIDDMNRVFTTAAVFSGQARDPELSYVQMLTPGRAPLAGQSATVKVTRWQVGGGAGFCEKQGGGGPCLSGIDVYRSKYKDLVFYAEPGGNNIGELNVSTNLVRRWSVAAVGAFEPRQLNIDNAGKVWVVTGSGHLVSLDPVTSKMTRHEIPVPVDSDLFGVAPDDDVVGYTDAQLSENKVAMLFPKGHAVYVNPDCETINPLYADVLVSADTSVADSATVEPQGKIAPVTITSKDDGTFVEARIAEAVCVPGPCPLAVPSFSPRGITPNRGKAQGAFFYTVGFSDAIRIGFARLPHKDKIKHGRDDDDCDDGEDAARHPGWHDHSHADDADDDGVDSKYDMRTSREDAETGEPVALAAGQSREYPMSATATSLALIANVIADNPMAQMGVEIYNPLGALVASGASVGGVAVATVPSPGAGAYKVRVKNYGLGSVNQTPTLLVREPWLP